MRLTLLLHTHAVVAGNCADLFIVLGLGQRYLSVRVEAAKLRTQLEFLLQRQVRSNRVDGDHEGPTVRLELL